MTYFIENERELLAIPIVGIVVNVILYMFILSTFFLASFIDPGIYPREHTDEEDDFRQPLYKIIDVNGIQVKMKWCETCKFYRPPRCSHCSICDNCVESFDHHCPWIDNCVGKRNYKYFLFFVTSLTIWILTGFGWAILSIMFHKAQLHVVVVEFILLLVGVLVFIPVVGLASFHVVLVCKGRTTNEHVTGKFRGAHNPYDMGCMRNCASVLCAPKKPRYMHYQIKPYYPLREPMREGGSQSRQGEASPRGLHPAAVNDLRCMPVYEELDNHASIHATLQNGANQNAASAGSGGSVGGERVGNGSEVVSPGGSSTLHGHGGGSEMREITV